MLIREFYKTIRDGVNLYRTYSDANKYILQHPTEIKYAEAVDIEASPYTYTETDEEIIIEETDEEIIIEEVDEDED